MTEADSAGERRITATERSGVLYPERLARYAAGWIDPGAGVGDVVDQYWHVAWSLAPGEVFDQPIIDLPAVTVTIEDGDVPAPLMVTGVQDAAWRRSIHGTGSVFAIRLRPAGLGVLSDLSASDVANATRPLTAELDARLHALVSGVAAVSGSAARARAADRAIEAALVSHGPSQSGLLANRVLDELRRRVHHRTSETLTQRFSCSERSIQRACTQALGHGPKWLSRRIRLQEVALALATRLDDSLGVIAVELGYADQSHLTRDFRSATGMTPEAYRRAIARPLADPIE